MAEMTVAEAIAVLHNNQYQKHIGNGEYDYIHPLTDAEAKLIEKLIEQQAAEIERLQRCGNCNNCTYEPYDDECPACDLSGGLVDMTDKCDKWQGV